LCLYELIDLRDVPKDDRLSALEFQINKKSPFQQTAYHTEWKEGMAMVWFWDKANVTKTIEEQAIEVFDILPETVLHEKPEADGLVITRTLDDGYDIQAWANGVLLCSNWSDKLPESDTVILFNKGLPRISGYTFELPDSIVADSAITKLGQTRWSGTSNSNLFKGFNLEPVFASLLLVASLGFIQWQVIANIKADNALTSIEESIAAAYDKAGPIADARDKAMQSQHQIQQINQLIDFPDQLKLLSVFGNMVAQKNGQLKEWRFNLNKLELTIETSSNNALEYVNDIQTLERVASVSTETARVANQIKIIIEFQVN